MQRALILALVIFTTMFAAACNEDTSTAPTATAPELLGSADVGSPSSLVAAIPPGATPHGKTYAEWSADWWRWLWSAPPAVNPGLDETGENVDYGQSGSVWFIAPNYGGVSERYATIPAGKSLFVDVAAWFFAPQLGDPEDEDELRAAVKEAADATQNVRLVVDGVEIPDIDDYRVQSDLFSYTVPADNMFTLFGLPTDAGTYYPAVSEGWFVMLPPLSKGEHTLHIYSEPPGYGVSDVTLHLTVTGGGKGQEHANQ